MDQASEYVRRILKVLIYIEKNIDEELTIAKLAKIACYSPFHFNRVFQAIVGQTVFQYVKKLRIHRAAGKLRYTNLPVTEIALDTSYDTPSAFTKAFKQFMGTSPKRYRAMHNAINKMTKKIEMLPMIYPEIIEKSLPDLSLLFIRSYGNYIQAPWEAWPAMISFINENYVDRSEMRYFGICHDALQLSSGDKLHYDVAILSPEKIKEKSEVSRQILKGGKYAIFTHTGPYQGLEETFNRIFLKWLPDSQENLDESRLVFCEYFNLECLKTNPEKLVTKLHIPLLSDQISKSSTKIEGLAYELLR